MGTTNILDLNNRVSDLEKVVSGGDSAQANKKDIATEFSDNTAYTAGCFVYYKGKLYQFNTDHAAGAWDSAEVSEANVSDEITSNKAAIDQLDDRLDDVESDIDDLPASVGNVRIAKLWENSDPTQPIAANAEFTINTAGYEFVMFVFAYSNTFLQYEDSIIIKQGAGTSFNLPSGNGTTLVSRNWNYVSDTKYQSGTPYNAGQESTSAAIPIAAYGIKFTS